jgi:hypothetical protein
MGRSRWPQPLENVRYPTARQACIHLEREGFAGKDVDDAEQAEFASGGERILEKIERPLLVGPLGWCRATTSNGW